MLFTTHDKLVVSLRGRRDRTGGVLFMVENSICARREKHKSFKAVIMKSSKIGKVVLMGLAPRKAIGMRFEEGWR